MSRGRTDLASNDYDQWLAKNRKEKELLSRRHERLRAHDRNGIGWHHGIDAMPVKVKDKKEFRKVLEDRDLAIKGEYSGGRKCPKMSDLEADWRKRNGK